MAAAAVFAALAVGSYGLFGRWDEKPFVTIEVPPGTCGIFSVLTKGARLYGEEAGAANTRLVAVDARGMILPDGLPERFEIAFEAESTALVFRTKSIGSQGEVVFTEYEIAPYEGCEEAVQDLRPLELFAALAALKGAE